MLSIGAKIGRIIGNVTIKRRILAVIILGILIWGLWDPPAALGIILRITENEVKMLMIYFLIVVLVPIPENLLVIMAALFLIGFSSGEFGGLVIFISLTVFLYRLFRGLTRMDQVET